MIYYEVRKEIEYGCIIYSVYDKRIDVRVNHYGNYDDAMAFAERQEAAKVRRNKKTRRVKL